MKRYLSLILIITLLSLTATSFAQKKQKFGHIDYNELMKIMPGTDSALAKLQDYQKELETQVKGMQNEFETKNADFQASEGKMTDLIKQTRYKELQDIQERIQTFLESANADLEKKRSELLKPIDDKAKAAIDKVAKDNAYTYIFDAGLGVLLFIDKSEDIMPLVKKELGL